MKVYNVVVLQVDNNRKLLTYYGDDNKKSEQKVRSKAKKYGKILEIY